MTGPAPAQEPASGLARVSDSGPALVSELDLALVLAPVPAWVQVSAEVARAHRPEPPCRSVPRRVLDRHAIGRCLRPRSAQRFRSNFHFAQTTR